MGLEFSERGQKITQDRLEHCSPWFLHGKSQRWSPVLLPHGRDAHTGKGRMSQDQGTDVLVLQ